MMGRRTFNRMSLAFAGIPAFLAITGCASLPEHSYKFKMIVEFDTPSGLQTGSSVYEVTAANRRALLPDEHVRAWSSRGEAVAVDLPNGATLFTLLKTGANQGDMASLSMAAFDPLFNNDIVESVERISKRRGVDIPATVKRSNYPMLVRFRDIKNPASVEAVDPDNLATSFGPGYRLKSLTVQVTDEAVTVGIEKRLEWLKGHRGALKPNPPRYLDDPTDPELRLLDTGPFSTEIFK